MLGVLSPPELRIEGSNMRDDIGSLPHGDDGKGEGAGEMENGCQHAAHLPRNQHSSALVPLRPDQVEEEGRAKDEGDKHAGEDVVAARAHVVVVVHLDPVRGDGLNLPLSLDVVYGLRVSMARVAASGLPGMYIPDNTAVPSDSETTQKINAHWYTMNFVRRRWYSLFHM